MTLDSTLSAAAENRPRRADALEQNLRDALDGGERILWTGYPRQGIAFSAGDILFIPFSLLWGGFAIFWEASVMQTKAPFFFRLFGVPFVLVGLYIIAGRFFVDAWVRARTIYAVTDQRVIILTRGFQQQVQSLALRSLSEVSLSERRNGSGTITFGPTTYAGMAPRGWPGNGRYRSPAFVGIPNARAVLKTIRDAQKSQ